MRVNRQELTRSIFTTADDPEIYHGAPVGIQIVGKKFEEEKVLAIAHLVNQALQESEGSKPNPRL